jgi:hypothetical protein
MKYYLTPSHNLLLALIYTNFIPKIKRAQNHRVDSNREFITYLSILHRTNF